MLEFLIPWRRIVLIGGVVLVGVAVVTHVNLWWRASALEAELEACRARAATLQQAVDSARRREEDARRATALATRRLRESAQRLAALRARLGQAEEQLGEADTRSERDALAAVIAAIRRDMAAAAVAGAGR